MVIIADQLLQGLDDVNRAVRNRQDSHRAQLENKYLNESILDRIAAQKALAEGQKAQADLFGTQARVAAATEADSIARVNEQLKLAIAQRNEVQRRAENVGKVSALDRARINWANARAREIDRRLDINAKDREIGVKELGAEVKAAKLGLDIAKSTYGRNSQPYIEAERRYNLARTKLTDAQTDQTRSYTALKERRSEFENALARTQIERNEIENILRSDPSVPYGMFLENQLREQQIVAAQLDNEFQQLANRGEVPATAVDQARIALLSAQEQETQARTEYQQLVNRGGVPASDLDRATQRLRDAQTGLTNARQQYQQLANRGEVPATAVEQSRQRLNTARTRLTDIQSQIEEARLSGLFNRSLSDVYKEKLLGYDLLQREFEEFERGVATRRQTELAQNAENALEYVNDVVGEFEKSDDAGGILTKTGRYFNDVYEYEAARREARNHFLGITTPPVGVAAPDQIPNALLEGRVPFSSPTKLDQIRQESLGERVDTFTGNANFLSPPPDAANIATDVLDAGLGPVSGLIPDFSLAMLDSDAHSARKRLKNAESHLLTEIIPLLKDLFPVSDKDFESTIASLTGDLSLQLSPDKYLRTLQNAYNKTYHTAFGGAAAMYYDYNDTVLQGKESFASNPTLRKIYDQRKRIRSYVTSMGLDFNYDTSLSQDVEIVLDAATLSTRHRSASYGRKVRSEARALLDDIDQQFSNGTIADARWQSIDKNGLSDKDKIDYMALQYIVENKWPGAISPVMKTAVVNRLRGQ